MRVISGSRRGLKLVSATGMDTRPTLDRVKEAVFSMIFQDIDGAVILDAFSGSGALGIESLSRGAERAVFVDNNASALSCINSNIRSAKFEYGAEVISDDVFKFLDRCKEKFDIIFLDPPYSMNFYLPFTKIIYEKNLIQPDGIIVAEWDSNLGKPEFDAAFEETKEKKYGRVGISILKRS